MWKAFAPANIALIKYMGKEEGNIPTNPSLSMTLSDFRSTVEVEKIDSPVDLWQPLPGSSPLRVESTERFMNFFRLLKKRAEVGGHFLVRSGNNFPSDAGLASSASSFAALTIAAEMAFASLLELPLPPPAELAKLSRTGSGSSCRSFFSPWCAWEGENVFPLEVALPPLIDLVAVVSGDYKKVSSSEAHRRVRTSPLFEKRSERARLRWQELRAALTRGDFAKTAAISRAELWDMHSLFHTSDPSFTYFAPETLRVLHWADSLWEKQGRGPIPTIDAGPNVHLLVPESEAPRYKAELAMLPGIRVLESRA